MNKAIRVLTETIKQIKSELRIFSLPENYNESIITDCKIEIKELKKALHILNDFNN